MIIIFMNYQIQIFKIVMVKHQQCYIAKYINYIHLKNYYVAQMYKTKMADPCNIIFQYLLILQYQFNIYQIIIYK